MTTTKVHMRALAILLLIIAGFILSCTEKEIKPVAVTAVTLAPQTLKLAEGETEEVFANISPSNAENKNVIWNTSNRSVATVSNGIVTAVKAGETTITAKTEDGGFTATCRVTVTEKVYPVTGITLDKESAEITEGETTTISATISPSNASNKNIQWTSSNTNVATVSNGIVTAVKAGEATITAKTEDGGFTATCQVTVTEKVYPVTGITLDKESAEITEGETTTISATISPSNASNKNIQWTSSNTNVATVSNGIVTAVKAGETTITAKTEDGGFTATCRVTVTEKVYSVTGITLDKTSVEIVVGNKHILKAIISPANATNKNITWSSSNPTIAAVNDSGEISAISTGKATISVITEDGNYSAKCEITIIDRVVEGGTEDTSDEDWGI